MMKFKLLVAILVSFLLFAFSLLLEAHPGTGIVVDKHGNIFFIHTGAGVVKVTPEGRLSYIYRASSGGHWMCLDEKGIFSNSKPKYFTRITPDGTAPAIIYASGGSPIAVGIDGYFYYCGGEHGDLNPGALSIVRETTKNQQTLFSPVIEEKLNELKDGITGIAAAPDNSIYLACWNSIIRINHDGVISNVIHPVPINDCDRDPADHLASNKDKVLLRGIDVDSSGNVFAAATSCHCLIKVSTDGKITTILKSERPWTPTGVAVRNGNIYVLEYTNANGPATEGWFPRVRKVAKDGKISTVADLSVSSLISESAGMNDHFRMLVLMNIR